MASLTSKKKVFRSSNNFDIDSDLDLPDLPFDDKTTVKDDRSPVTKTLKSAVRGAATEVLNPGIITSTIRRSLPAAYGDTLDLAEGGARSVKSLYHDAAEELKPAVKDIKRSVGRVLPKIEGKLSKKWAERLKNWSKDDDSGKRDLSAQRQREDALTIELGQMFQAQQEQDNNRQEVADRKDELREGIAQVRHRDNIEQLDSIRESVARLANYQDKVLVNYQRKSLELQFRQYFATADILDLQRRSAEETKNQLAGILKNTGLPEFVKIRTSEQFADISKTKFLENVRENLFGGASDYVNRFMQNVVKSAKAKLSDGIQAVSSGAMLADMATSGMEIADDLGGGPDKYEIGGGVAGSLGARFGIGRGQKWLKKKLADNPAVLKGAENLRYRLDNAGPLLKDYFNNPDKNWGVGEGLREFLAENLPGLQPETKLQTDAIDKMHQPAVFTSAVSKTIIEVIPGFLARINRELQILRTGNESAPLLTYDFDNNKFSTVGQLAADLRQKIGSKYDRERVGDRLNDLVGFIDKDKKLSPEAQKALKKELLDMSIKRRNTDAENVADPTTWRKLGKDSYNVASLFQELLQTDLDGKRGTSLEAIRNQRMLSEKIRDLGYGVDDPRGRIQALSNVGQGDVLSAAGVVKDKGVISLDALRDILLGEDYQIPGEGPTQQGTTGKGLKRKPLRRTHTTRPDYRPQPVHEGLKFSDEGIIRSVDDLSKAVKAESSKSNIQIITDTIQSIEKKIDAGLVVFSGDFSDLTEGVGQKMGPHLDKWRARFRDIKSKVSDKVKSWKELTIGDLFGKAGEFGKKTFKTAQEMGKRSWTMARTVGGGLFNTGRALTTMGLSKAADYFGDIYVGEEQFPRLTRAAMLAGEYFDQKTGKVIKSLKDISGPVVDKDGNVLLGPDDLPKAVLKGKVSKLLSNVLSSAAKKGFEFFTKASALAGGIYGVGIKAAMAGFQFIKKKLPPYDVYIKGQEEPILFAVKMKAGDYFSKKTGLPITHPRDIDGPVIDKDGNYVVTDDDFKLGLVDKNGVAITNFAGRQLAKLKNAFGAGIRMLKGIATNAREFFMGFGDALRDIFGGIFGLRGEYLDVSKQQLDTQLKILELLNERLPKKGSAIGDSDGDGIRDNSAEDLRRKAAAKQEKSDAAQAAAQASPGGGKGIAGMLASGLKGIQEKLGGKKKESEGEGGDTNIFGGGGGEAKPGAPKAPGPAKPAPTTRMGKIGAGLKNIGGKAWGGLKGAGRFGLGLLGLGGAASTIGSVGSFLGRTAMGAGRLALGATGTIARGALSLGGLALSAAGLSWGALGAGALAVLTSPITLTALGIGALAAGAYFGYKYLTRAKLDTLSTVRYAQYGFDKDDKDHLGPIFELESKLEPLVTFEGGKAAIDISKTKPDEIMKPFGISNPDSEEGAKWLQWFEVRFKPVFLAHYSALKAINPKLLLAKVDDMETADKQKFLDATSLPDGPYAFRTSPFKDQPQGLVVDAAGVRNAVDVAKTKLEKEALEGKGSKKVATAAGVAGATALATQGRPGEAQKLGPDGKPLVGAAAAAAGMRATQLSGTDVPTSVDKGIPISANGNVADYLFTGQEGRLDALTSVRMKAYGLEEMDASKVRALRRLEVFVNKNIRFDKNGAYWDDDAEVLLENVKTAYGISGSRSPRGYDWMEWFKFRFLPVYLNFASAIEKATKKKDIVQGEMSLTPNDQLTVANVIKATMTTYKGSRVPVWDVEKNPFGTGAMNMDANTVEPNIDAITQAVKAVILGEQKSAKIQQEAQQNWAKAVKDGTAANPMAMTDTAGGAAVGTRKDPSTIRRDREAMSAIYTNNQAAPLRSDGVGVRAVGDFTGGAAINHPGGGTGGDINQIPDVKGKGWDNVKDTINAAAKMVGVDPSLMKTFADIESGFDPTARPAVDKSTGKRASGAVGLYQFIPSTWNEMMRKYGPKYGLAPETPPTDARANALMGAEFLRENAEYLKNKLGRPATATDLYLAHFLGKGGAVNFLKNDPNAVAADALPKEAAANRPIFFDRDGRSRTFGEIYQLFNGKVNRRMSGAANDPTVARPSAGGAQTTAAPDTGTMPDASEKKASTDKPATGFAGSINRVATTDAAATAMNQAATTTAPVAAVAPTTPAQTPVAKPTAAATPVVSAPVQPQITRPVPNFSGFNPSQVLAPQDQRAQAQVTTADAVARMQGISDILSSSLDVQKDSAKTLKDILAALNRNAGQAAAAPAPASDTATATAGSNVTRLPSGPKASPSAPVSMAKKSFVSGN